MPIFGSACDLSLGHSVSLSDDGSILAVGSEPSFKQGVVQTLIWNEGNGGWQPLGDIFSVGLAEASIGRLSHDGSTLSMSSIEDGQDIVTETTLYQFHYASPQCKEDEFLLRFSLLMDSLALEVAWRVEDEEGNTVFPTEEEETPLYDFAPLVHEWCVNNQQCLTIKLFDFGGNGLCCGDGE